MRTQFQEHAAWLLAQYGGLWALPEEYRRAHAEAEAWRQRGVLLDNMPPKVREKERVYQAARHLERRRRQHQKRTA